MVRVFLGLGTNDGDREELLKAAMGEIGARCGRLVAVSAVYETAAWGLTDQPDFLNMVVELETPLAPTELLDVLQDIEADLQRVRVVRWGPRTMDLDLLFYGDEVIETERLTVPHPRIAERRFVLVPLVEIAADFVHPVNGKTIVELLEECPDTLEVRKLA
ncbi:MAG: 2-amino-4-hydroxy-6-hydroxymethyldihydropteridine diphosphokinase [Flavipsychrobacter sp.]|nr:2-amino-4-hydroxy-6-hydroxymethyldihydropteridine diphosphokinase [Flavipsychrobacter sp.]